MSRIYHVTTPAGVRLVKANTPAQAVRYCAKSLVQARPVKTDELADLLTGDPPIVVETAGADEA
jgi:hypothetical protein